MIPICIREMAPLISLSVLLRGLELVRLILRISLPLLRRIRVSWVILVIRVLIMFVLLRMRRVSRVVSCLLWIVICLMQADVRMCLIILILFMLTVLICLRLVVI